MDSILKKVHLASVNDTFKVVRFLRNGVLKCRYFDSIHMARPHIINITAKITKLWPRRGPADVAGKI